MYKCCMLATDLSGCTDVEIFQLSLLLSNMLSLPPPLPLPHCHCRHHCYLVPHHWYHLHHQFYLVLLEGGWGHGLRHQCGCCQGRFSSHKALFTFFLVFSGSGIILLPVLNLWDALSWQGVLLILDISSMELFFQTHSDKLRVVNFSMKIFYSHHADKFHTQVGLFVTFCS